MMIYHTCVKLLNFSTFILGFCFRYHHEIMNDTHWCRTPFFPHWTAFELWTLLNQIRFAQSIWWGTHYLYTIQRLNWKHGWKPVFLWVLVFTTVYKYSKKNQISTSRIAPWKEIKTFLSLEKYNFLLFERLYVNAKPQNNIISCTYLLYLPFFF